MTMWQADSIIVIVTGGINLLALIFVGWQAFLTRRSLALMQTSTKETQRARELTQLPDSDQIMHVIAHLDLWRQELHEIVHDQQVIKSRIVDGDKNIVKQYGLNTSKGIIRKAIYDRLSPWLQYVLMSAAKYYFDGKSFAYVLSECDSKTALDMLPTTIDRCKVGISRIDEMKSSIDYIVPEWYLNSPASVGDSKFFD
jgi:hypothetical protein